MFWKGQYAVSLCVVGSMPGLFLRFVDGLAFPSVTSIAFLMCLPWFSSFLIKEVQVMFNQELPNPMGAYPNLTSLI